MEHPISPWYSETLHLDSPDMSKRATLIEPSEIAMGSPTCGELSVSNGQSASNCNPSIVWSENSRFLAVPQWFDRKQRLLLLDTDSRKRAFAPEWFSVLELHAFSNGIVTGIDSPLYQPRRIAFDVRNLFPDG